MEKELFSETITVGKGVKRLILVVNTRDIASYINVLKDTLSDCKSNPDKLEEYISAEASERKDPIETLQEMEADILEFENYAKGFVRITKDSLTQEIDNISEEIFGKEYQQVDWASYFKKIPRKKDGTFAIGRIVGVTEGHGFSHEDIESYGRRGPEMIIKTDSDTTAELFIRTGIIEKW